MDDAKNSNISNEHSKRDKGPAYVIGNQSPSRKPFADTTAAIPGETLAAKRYRENFHPMFMTLKQPEVPGIWGSWDPTTGPQRDSGSNDWPQYDRTLVKPGEGLGADGSELSNVHTTDASSQPADHITSTRPLHASVGRNPSENEQLYNNAIESTKHQMDESSDLPAPFKMQNKASVLIEDGIDEDEAAKQEHATTAAEPDGKKKEPTQPLAKYFQRPDKSSGWFALGSIWGRQE